MTEQTAYTKLFIEHIESLLEKGTINNYVDVAEKLDWSQSSLTSVIKGRRNVPRKIYVKFKTIYKLPDINQLDTPKQADNDVYKDKYIALLESQVKHFDLILNELKEMKELFKNRL